MVYFSRLTHLNNIFCITTDTTNDAVESVIEEIKGEMHRLLTEIVSEEELNIVKNYYAGKVCRTYETNFSYINLLMRKISLGENVNDILDIQRYVHELKPVDIINFANENFTLEHFLWSVAGV